MKQTKLQKIIDQRVLELLNGQRFRYDKHELYYDNICLVNGSNPFRCRLIKHFSSTGIEGYWEKAAEWIPASAWYEFATKENPVFCWVSNRKKEEKTRALWVYRGPMDQFYVDMADDWYKYATPVTYEDLEHHFEQDYS